MKLTTEAEAAVEVKALLVIIFFLMFLLLLLLLKRRKTIYLKIDIDI